MTDRLSALLGRFELRARVFRAGGIYAAETVTPMGDTCHLHLMRAGSMSVTGPIRSAHIVEQPSAVFLRRPHAYRARSRNGEADDVVSAAVEFGLGNENPLIRSLPEVLIIPLACVPSLDAIQQVLFTEARERRCGHAAVVARLTEVLVIQLLRFAIARQLVESGSLAGLSDPRLAKALTAMHADPSQAWTLESMADIAGMSRSRFAASFAEIVGVPPGEYLVQWRLGVAKMLLRRGVPVKRVALEVGYGSASALTRAFAHSVGVTPTQWLARQRGSPTAIGEDERVAAPHATQ